MSQLTGRSTVAGRPLDGTDGSMRALEPASGQFLEPAYDFVGADAAGRAAQAAADAFGAYRATTPTERAAFLDRIADRLDELGDTVIDRACAESGLPRARITGELARTTGQLRLFGETVRAGAHQGVRIDRADPDRTPLPLPDIRQRWIPLGPVVVFGASNFPLAFSTAGGDTASALAAGCPVVVKAHNAHPGTAELVGRAIDRAVADCDLPAGVFSQLFGADEKLGLALVTDPRIKAVGFTGSRGGGLALVDAAARRPEPIPVYAEMSSVNPVVLLPGALDERAGSIATQFVASMTQGAGQFCTNPGLVFVPAGAAGEAFASAAADAVGAAVGAPMLTPRIHESYGELVARAEATQGVQLAARGDGGSGPFTGAPVLLRTSADAFAAARELEQEIFGAASLLVEYDSAEQLTRVLAGLEGQLTATVHTGPGDEPVARQLIPVLEDRVGRILFDGWPTGVEVDHAMVHGGPYPATSAPRTTSVGTLAIERWQRPVSYQNVPPALLPEAVRDDNPWELPREIDGRRERP